LALFFYIFLNLTCIYFYMFHYPGPPKNVMFLVVFILTTDQELWARELICRIIGCDHSLGLKEFLNQLNLLYF
jgi:hypothetical protein